MPVSWFRNRGKLKTQSNHDVEIIEFVHEADEQILSAWSRHLRNHYCLDEEIDDLRDGTGLSKQEFLKNIKFPDAPMIISGDFSEILVADYLQFVLNYEVPRTRYREKENKNTSPNGIDVIGYKLHNPTTYSQNDILITFEVKGSLASASSTSLLRAFNDSKKDYELRKPESLHAIKQRLKSLNKNEEAQKIQRFQNKTDRPYSELTGAAAIHSNHSWTEDVVIGIETNDHPNSQLLFIAIKGEDLMTLARELYRRAHDEA